MDAVMDAAVLTAGCPPDWGASECQEREHVDSTIKVNNYPCEYENDCSFFFWPLTFERRHSSSHDLIHQQDVAGDDRAVKRQREREIIYEETMSEDNSKYSTSPVSFRSHLTMNGGAVSWRCNCPIHLHLQPPWLPLKDNRISLDKV